MDCEGAVYYKIKFKNNPATIEGVTPYTTPERIREREKPYEDVRTVVEARPAKPTDKAVCEYCGDRVPVSKALLKQYYSNGDWRWGIFCDASCHNFRQMGAEG